MSESSLVKAHQPCPDCGSHDALSVYTDHTFCFSCSTRHWNDGKVEKDYEPFERRLERMEEGKIREIADRCLTEETCRKFGVRSLVKDHRIQKHFYSYYNKAGEKVAEKTRIVDTKQFFWTGSQENLQLFGAQCQPTTGKFVVVCEGEIDCLTMWQVLGGRSTCVSIPNGCKSFKAIKDNYEYLDKFDNIVLCMDGDKAGRESIEKMVQYLPQKKLKIMRMPEDMKDPNEFLKAGKAQELVNLFWRAETYTPNDIVNISQMYERLEEFHKSHPCTPTPWQGLNDMIHGTLPGQLVILTGASGAAKSTFMRWWMDYLVQTTDFRVGGLFFEELPEETVMSLMSIKAGLNLKVPQIWEQCSKEDLQKWFDLCKADSRIDLYEPTSSTDPDHVCNRILYLARARDCKIIFLDHLHFLTESSSDPLHAINKLCNDLCSLCVELGITIIAACHLRKSPNQTTTHEEGNKVTMDDLKGSSTIKQMASTIISVERNGQDPDPIKANTSIIRVLKNRAYGTKGICTAVYYDKDTTRLQEVGVDSTDDIGDLKDD